MDTDTTLTEMATSEASAHTSSHKSALPIRMDLIPRGERRRRWTIEQKQTIAAQSLAPGASPTNIARLHSISTGQLYTWRRSLMRRSDALPALKWHLSRWRLWISRRGRRV